jgi:hypothetical protein
MRDGASPPPGPPVPGGVAVGVGDIGDEPPQAEKSDTAATPDATWQAPAQNLRRDPGVFVSDIPVPERQSNAAKAARLPSQAS